MGEFLAIHAAWVRSICRAQDERTRDLAYLLLAQGAYKGMSPHRLIRHLLGREPGTVPGATPEKPADAGLSADDSVAWVRAFIDQRKAQTVTRERIDG